LSGSTFRGGITALAESEFREALTLSQVLPGPNLINLSAFLGMILRGWGGVVLGVFLLALPGALLGVAAIYFLRSENLNIKVLFQGFSLGSVILFFLFILRLLPGLREGTIGLASKKKSNRRYLLMLGVASFSLVGAPLLPVLFLGLGIAFIEEFSAGFWQRRSRIPAPKSGRGKV
jgi:chromate transporter